MVQRIQHIILLFFQATVSTTIMEENPNILQNSKVIPWL